MGSLDKNKDNTYIVGPTGHIGYRGHTGHRGPTGVKGSTGLQGVGTFQLITSYRDVHFSKPNEIKNMETIIISRWFIQMNCFFILF